MRQFIGRLVLAILTDEFPEARPLDCVIAEQTAEIANWNWRVSRAIFGASNLVGLVIMTSHADEEGVLLATGAQVCGKERRLLLSATYMPHRAPPDVRDAWANQQQVARVLGRFLQDACETRPWFTEIFYDDRGQSSIRVLLPIPSKRECADLTADSIGRGRTAIRRFHDVLRCGIWSVPEFDDSPRPPRTGYLNAPVQGRRTSSGLLAKLKL